MSRKRVPLFDHGELMEIAQALHGMTRQREASARYIGERIKEQGEAIWNDEDVARAVERAAEARALAVKALAAAFPDGPYAVDLLATWDAIFDESDARERAREGARP